MDTAAEWQDRKALWVTVLSWHISHPHVFQAAVMELDLWRWPSWRSCPPSHAAVLVEWRPGLDGIQNLLFPPSLGQTLWETLNLLSATNN